MSVTKVQGDIAFEKIIGQTKRKQPRYVVMQEVKTAVEDTLTRLDDAWPKRSEVKFHVVVTVERP